MQTEGDTPKSFSSMSHIDLKDESLHMGQSLYSMETKTGDEKFCNKCNYILMKCGLLEAMYCENCSAFICSRCKEIFSKNKTCICGRCTCCFLEICLPNHKIGKQCQNVCHTCYEENEPTSDNIVRYPCGHGICRICLFQHTINEKFDPNYCYVCNK